MKVKGLAGRIALALSALLAAGQGARAAQAEATSLLPPVSVGDELLWAVGDQDLELRVPVGGPVRLELYSPDFDPTDYRGAAFGDETYVPGRAVTTTFILQDSAGRELARRVSAEGPHAWSALITQDLPAGTYRLRAMTQGPGKNAFAVRVAGVSAVLRAQVLSVNVHSRGWVPTLRVQTEVGGPGHLLRLYDGDGPEELEARLIGPDGRVLPVAVSADLASTDVALPKDGGEYVLELRQGASAQQFSNTVAFELLRAAATQPIVLARSPELGRLRVQAELLLPGGARPTSAQVRVDGQDVDVAGESVLDVVSGEHELEAAPVTGASVTVVPRVAVPAGGEATARVQVRPEVRVELRADRAEVCVGDRVALSARALTAYVGALPVDLRLDAPGLDLEPGEQSAPTTRAGEPAELTLSGVARVAGPVTVRAAAAGWGEAAPLALRVRGEATTLQLARDPLPAATVGAEVRVALTLTNTGAEPQPYELIDAPGTGLEALEPSEFRGTLAPGETARLGYRARVAAAGDHELRAELTSGACAVAQSATGVLRAEAPATPERRSTVSLPHDAPAQARALLIAQALPAEAEYVPGSARLNGLPVADPQRGPSGRLYWTVPVSAARGDAAVRGVLTYDLRHEGPLGALSAPALRADLGGGRAELLQGELDAADLALSGPLAAVAAGPQENAGAIKLPLQGAQVRVRDRVSVVVEGPLAGGGELRVNGEAVPEGQIGETTLDEARGVRRATYVGVPLRPGANALTWLGETVTVQRVGEARTVEVTPLALTADGSTPLRLRLRALDAAGLQTPLPSVVLRSNLEPRAGSAASPGATYTLDLKDGEGVLELRPQAAPTTLKLDVLLGQQLTSHTFEVRPDGGRVGVGLVSATLGLDGDLNLSDDLRVQARASLETPLGAGKLYLAADKDGLPTDRDVLRGAAFAGDASAESVPLQGLDPVALTYDHPRVRVDYRQAPVPMDVLPVGEALTALSAVTRGDGPAQVSGFAALVPDARVTGLRLTPTGTRLLRLPHAGVVEGSESLVVLTLEAGTGKELARRVLARGADYLLDARTGIVTLTSALDRTDPELRDVRVLAAYRLADPTTQRRAAFGVQVRRAAGYGTVGAAAVRLDDAVTYGARATYDNGAVRADGLVAVSGGVQATADVGWRRQDASVEARLRYQDETYGGLNPITPGLSVSGTARARLTPRVGVSAAAEYHDRVGPAGSPAGSRAQGGSVTARADYAAAPLTFGAGVRYAYGDTSGLGAVLGAGYHAGRVDVDVTHTQPLSGTLEPETVVSAKYALSDSLSLGFQDTIGWRSGQRAVLSLESRVGRAAYSAAYELPSAGGDGNRARFGVSTNLALGDRASLGLRGSALRDLAAGGTELGAGADLQYRSGGAVATLGTDLTYRDVPAQPTQNGFGVVLRGGLSGAVTGRLTLSASGLAEFGAGRGGVRASVGYAYRGERLNSLGTVRYINGSLAGNAPELSSTLSAEYRQSNWALRGGLDTRTLLADPDSFTAQASVGGTYHLTDYFGVGAWGRLMVQPASGQRAAGLGLEASLRALPGTWLSVGYNPLGFEGLGSAYTRRGAYVRLDLTLDETLGAQR